MTARSATVLKGYFGGGNNVKVTEDHMADLIDSTPVNTSAATSTTALTTVTCAAPSTPDYAIADLINTAPYGFVAADEGQTVLKVIANLQIRMAEVETKLKALGIMV